MFRPRLEYLKPFNKAFGNRQVVVYTRFKTNK